MGMLREEMVGWSDIKEKELSREEVYDRATWGRISAKIDTTKKRN